MTILYTRILSYNDCDVYTIYCVDADEYTANYSHVCITVNCQTTNL